MPTKLKTPKGKSPDRLSSPKSPGWTLGRQDLFKTPKSPSPIRRTRRSVFKLKASPLVKADDFTEGSLFKMPANFSSPPGVKTRTRRSSMYQKQTIKTTVTSISGGSGNSLLLKEVAISVEKIDGNLKSRKRDRSNSKSPTKSQPKRRKFSPIKEPVKKDSPKKIVRMSQKTKKAPQNKKSTSRRATIARTKVNSEKVEAIVNKETDTVSKMLSSPKSKRAVKEREEIVKNSPKRKIPSVKTPSKRISPKKAVTSNKSPSPVKPQTISSKKSVTKKSPLKAKKSTKTPRSPSPLKAKNSTKMPRSPSPVKAKNSTKTPRSPSPVKAKTSDKKLTKTPRSPSPVKAKTLDKKSTKTPRSQSPVKAKTSNEKLAKTPRSPSPVKAKTSDKKSTKTPRSTSPVKAKTSEKKSTKTPRSLSPVKAKISDKKLTKTPRSPSPLKAKTSDKKLTKTPRKQAALTKVKTPIASDSAHKKVPATKNVSEADPISSEISKGVKSAKKSTPMVKTPRASSGVSSRKSVSTSQTVKSPSSITVKSKKTPAQGRKSFSETNVKISAKKSARKNPIVLLKSPDVNIKSITPKLSQNKLKAMPAKRKLVATLQSPAIGKLQISSPSVYHTPPTEIKRSKVQTTVCFSEDSTITPSRRPALRRKGTPARPTGIRNTDTHRSHTSETRISSTKSFASDDFDFTFKKDVDSVITEADKKFGLSDMSVDHHGDGDTSLNDTVSHSNNGSKCIIL